MRTVTGLTRLRRGRVLLDGTDISRLPPHRIARAGVAYLPSGRRVFGSLTIRQNLELALRDARKPAPDDAPSEPPPWTLSRVHATFPRLAELSGRRASFLSGGEQQMLKLARALLARPRLLLLDEPTEGLAPVVVARPPGRRRAEGPPPSGTVRRGPGRERQRLVNRRLNQAQAAQEGHRG